MDAHGKCESRKYINIQMDEKSNSESTHAQEEEEEIYLTQIRNNHGNSTQIVQSQVARKPEGQQCWPPIISGSYNLTL